MTPAAAAPQGPSRAGWRHVDRRRYQLVDDTGTPFGGLEVRGPTLQRATATVAGHPMELTGRSLFRCRVTVADPHGVQLAAVRVGMVRWRGQAQLADGAQLAVDAGPGAGQVCVGPPSAPLLRAWRPQGRTLWSPVDLDIDMAAGLPARAPALLPAVLLLWLLRQQSTTAA